MAYAVEAKYLGYHDGSGYWVNVRTANPTGNIGDAGVIRRFETKEAAKEYAKTVNSTGVDTFTKQTANNDKPVCHEGDTFVSSKNISNSKSNSVLNPYQYDIDGNDTTIEKLGKTAANQILLQPEEGLSGVELLGARLHNQSAAVLNPVAGVEYIKSRFNQSK